MKVIFRGLICLIVFFTISKPVHAQKASDAKFLFKMWLFLEHNNNQSRYANQFPSKDSLLFDLWQTKIDLKLDTLKMTGFPSDYVFVAVSVSKKDFPIIYKKTKYLEFIDIPAGHCDAYILCVNKSLGISYRLKGFYGNDFLFLYQKIQTSFLSESHKQLSVRRFLKDYSVEGLDFECLFEGLTSTDTNLNKFPCLQKCSFDTVLIH